jgi:Icc-related predicted phosphoesterase
VTVRIAAVGDVHVGVEEGELIGLDDVDERADLLLLAGDLTRCGDPAEAEVLAAGLARLELPVVAVLGNHDHHADRVEDVVEILTDAGVCVLEGASTSVAVNGSTVGVVGLKGFGGGFAGACATEFGEPEMKAFAGHTRELAGQLRDALDTLQADLRIVLMHYSPVPETLVGESFEVYPFLGSYLLGEAVDDAGADLVVHGHAHRGSERGRTPGGVRVRNVARPVIGSRYRVFTLNTLNDDRG